jgi:integrase
LKVLIPIWTNKATTAQRVRQRIEAIWDFAKASGYVEGDNPAKLKGHLENLLPKAEKIKKIRHHPALPYQDIPDFIAKLQQRRGISALAFEFLILTATRTGDVIGAKLSEIDLEKAVWTIPAERFKTRKEFRVPLSSRTIELIELAQVHDRKSEFLFPGTKHNCGLSNGASLSLLKKMNYGHITPHGFRSTFRDWISEEAIDFSHETAELALGHAIKNRVEAAYRRGDQLDRRRQLMEKWNKFVDGK